MLLIRRHLAPWWETRVFGRGTLPDPWWEIEDGGGFPPWWSWVLGAPPLGGDRPWPADWDRRPHP